MDRTGRNKSGRREEKFREEIIMARKHGLSWRRGVLMASALGLGLAMAGAARAQEALMVYCAVQEEWCRAMVTAFERDTGVKVAMTRKSSGEIYAQVKAEASNPRADIWWGGTGDPHMQAAEE